MTDTLSKTERSKLMSRVRSAGTKPEWILRCGLHRLGFRYRLHNKHLPGCPDLVFRKYNAAIFVHGCFWHRHAGCKNASTPKSNVSFWVEKFSKNVERDRRVREELRSRGWRVLVVWECELTQATVPTIRKVADWLLAAEPSRSHLSYADGDVDRGKLLAIAEEKVRYRIASYDKPSKADTPAASEANQPCKKKDNSP